MPFWSKKEIDAPDLQKERDKLVAEITAEVEQKYRENFNFACLFQDDAPPSLIAVILPYINLVALVIIFIVVISK